MSLRYEPASESLHMSEERLEIVGQLRVSCDPDALSYTSLSHTHTYTHTRTHTHTHTHISYTSTTLSLSLSLSLSTALSIDLYVHPAFWSMR